MILDKRTEFADAASVAQAAGTYNLPNQIDLETARDMGNGQPLYLCIVVTTEIITGGSAGTIAFQLVSDASAAIATDGSQSLHYRSQAFVTDGTDATEMRAGKTVLMLAIPLEGLEPYERFLGVQYVVGTTTTTAGAVDAFLTLDPAGWKAYADAVN